MSVNMLLLSGYDTLHVGYQLERLSIDKGEWSYLEKNKLECQESKDLTDVPVRFKGRDWNLSRNGHHNWRYILFNDDIRLYLARNLDPNRSYPEIYTHFNAQYLWRGNWFKQVSSFEDWLYTYVKACDVKVSRADPCQDYLVQLPAIGTTTDIVTRARKKRFYAEHSNSYMNGRKPTGYEIGGRNLLCRIYNKSDEILNTGHDWFKDLWSQSLGRGLLGNESVTRVEFQLRREIIKQMQVSSVESLRDQSADIWKYMTKWLRLIPSSGNRQYSRRKPTQFWHEVQQNHSTYGSCTGVTRWRQREPKIEQLKSMVDGCLSSIVSLTDEAGYESVKEWLWDLFYDDCSDENGRMLRDAKRKQNTNYL